MTARTVLTPDGRWRFVLSGDDETDGGITLNAIDVHTGESLTLVTCAGDVSIDLDGSVLVKHADGPGEGVIEDCVVRSGECTTVVEGLAVISGLPGGDPS